MKSKVKMMLLVAVAMMATLLACNNKHSGSNAASQQNAATEASAASETPTDPVLQKAQTQIEADINKQLAASAANKGSSNGVKGVELVYDSDDSFSGTVKVEVQGQVSSFPVRGSIAGDSIEWHYATSKELGIK